MKLNGICSLPLLKPRRNFRRGYVAVGVLAAPQPMVPVLGE